MSLYLTLWLLLKVVVIVMAGKYVYSPLKRSFNDAQTFCRTNYTDMAPVNSKYDHGLIAQLDLPKDHTWIGLINTTNSSSGWMWSGGGEVSTFFWNEHEPNDHDGLEDWGVLDIVKYKWNDIEGSVPCASLCYRVHAVRRRMTWDDALQYCRRYHTDLVSVASDTEMMLIEKELKKDLSSYNVWIGLQFMDSTWQWMDGQPFTFESWGPSEKPTCPDMAFACGALRVRGTSPQVGNVFLKKVDFIEGWNALDCNWKLYFLCY